MERSLLILFGSQTGCAADVSQRLAREARRRLWTVRVMSMDAFDITQLPTEPLVVLVAATCGQGEAPDNMRRFWRFLLRKDLASDALSATRFTVFGLGDSSYPQYNAMARKLHQRFLDLGATPFYSRGLGDDQDPLRYVFCCCFHSSSAFILLSQMARVAGTPL
jgi:sulfite reductase alpha subunit-like flavoprotein